MNYIRLDCIVLFVQVYLSLVPLLLLLLLHTQQLEGGDELLLLGAGGGEGAQHLHVPTVRTRRWHVPTVRTPVLT